MSYFLYICYHSVYTFSDKEIYIYKSIKVIIKIMISLLIRNLTLQWDESVGLRVLPEKNGLKSSFNFLFFCDNKTCRILKHIATVFLQNFTWACHSSRSLELSAGVAGETTHLSSIGGFAGCVRFFGFARCVTF